MRIFGIVCAAVIAVFGLVLFTSYNGLQSAFTKIEADRARIDSAYTRQAELVGNLVSTVQGYANHERQTFVAVAEARALAMQAARASGPGALQEQDQARERLNAAVVADLRVVQEQYPQLQSAPLFRDLAQQLTFAANQINASRGLYIQSVRAYNGKMRIFPSNVIGRTFGFSEVPQFEARPEDRRTPQVQFN